IRLAINENTTNWCRLFAATTATTQGESSAAPPVLVTQPVSALQLQMMNDMASVDQILQTALAVVLSVVRHCSRDSIDRIVSGIVAALQSHRSEQRPAQLVLYFLGFLST